MATMSFMLLCIAAEGFLLFVLVQFVREGKRSHGQVGLTRTGHAARFSWTLSRRPSGAGESGIASSETNPYGRRIMASPGR
jgi:hypothetical protein